MQLKLCSTVANIRRAHAALPNHPIRSRRTLLLACGICGGRGGGSGGCSDDEIFTKIKLDIHTPPPEIITCQPAAHTPAQRHTSNGSQPPHHNSAGPMVKYKAELRGRSSTAEVLMLKICQALSIGCFMLRARAFWWINNQPANSLQCAKIGDYTMPLLAYRLKLLLLFFYYCRAAHMWQITAPIFVPHYLCAKHAEG
ncbi:unnamed protein product [Ceratitis capitata]|uniref:(Mediterranean fruit fly) hypothetical protein n=1 Tax=Ceratitis capitata TaxID=7213 RepID=A0A811V9Z3_CERCA|nr:unnamed protein product [Ceratitis capitata]